MASVAWGREQPCSAEWQTLIPLLLYMEEDICPGLDTSDFFHTANSLSCGSNIFKCTKGRSVLLLQHRKPLTCPRGELKILPGWANPQLEMAC